MSNNLISIIIPCYNASKYISQTISSVIHQSLENWEIICINDASTDQSATIIKKISKKESRIKLIDLTENSGPAITRNVGIRAATGRYIAFLDADDIWIPTKLERQVSFIQQHNLPLTFSSYHLIDKNENIIGTRKIKPFVSYVDMLKTNHIGNLTGIYDTKKLGKIYMNNCGHEDYTLWLKILKQTKLAYGIEEPLAMYRVHHNSLSSNKIHALKWQWHIYKDIEKIKFSKRLYYTAHYIYHGLTKRV
jgi:glycosyltransferase involved in cell wall biosynthesis